MDNTLLIMLALVVIILVGGWLLYNKRRSDHLRSRFGAEYERQVEEQGSRKAEAELADREKRVGKLTILPLSPADQDRFLDRWTKVQATFVDDPDRSIDYADALLAEVMNARGYPVSDFDQRAGDISVDHPNVVQHYRAGHDIAVRRGRGEASTDELRQALLHYRALFEELVTEREVATEHSH